MADRVRSDPNQQTRSVLSVRRPMQPATWGHDTLSEFMAAAHQNRLATFVNKPELYRRLSAIDECFHRIGSGWTMPASDSSRFIAVLLFGRAVGAYRAACESALAGQAVDSFVMVRSMLEASAYSLHIERNAELAEVWLRRHDDEAAKGAMLKSFSMAKLVSTIRACDRDGADRFDRLYQDAIDFGAHPNERAVTGSLTVTEEQGSNQRYEQQLLHGDGLALEHALINVARAGVCSLEVLQCAFPARFELLGVRYRILELRQGL